MALIACLLPLPVFVWVGIKICRAYDINNPARQEWVFLAMAIPTILLIGYWEFRTGTYALREKRAERTEPSGS